MITVLVLVYSKENVILALQEASLIMKRTEGKRGDETLEMQQKHSCRNNYM